MISNDLREQIRARTDIAELVGQYVPLRRAGHSMVARCPFHAEKTPSFHVSTERGLFHCFGCKVSGDVFTFYERIEGVGFTAALRALAERAGIVLVEEERDPARVAEEKRSREQSERLYEVCELAAAFFERSLRELPEAAAARDELTRRAMRPDVCERFRLGYAPARWDALAQFLASQHVSPADAELAGLLMSRKSGSGFYDRFRHRLMFPIGDRAGKVVAFSGRVLPPIAGIPEGLVPEDAGKYVNSPETPLYRKSDLLFGLAAARTAMRQNAEAILVEGNFDVLAMHQHGFEHTVAPLGTAFTSAQATLLRRFAESVVLLFDGDEAGRKAARAAHDVCAAAGIVARVAVLPRGKDPDEFLRDPGGPAELAKRIERAVSVVEWLIDDTGAHTADHTPARIASLRAIAPVLSNVSDPYERSEYVDRCARVLCLKPQLVARAVREAQNETRLQQRSAPFGTRVARDEPFRRDSSGESVPGEPSRPRGDALSVATADAIDAVIRCPSLLATDDTLRLLPLLDEATTRPIVAEARSQWLSRGQLDGPSIVACATTEKARTWLSERLVSPVDPEVNGEPYERALRESVRRLEVLRDRDRARELLAQSARARAAGDDELESHLLGQVNRLNQQTYNVSPKNRGTA